MLRRTGTIMYTQQFLSLQQLSDLEAGNTTLQKDPLSAPSNTEAEILSKVLSAHAIASNFEMRQTTGSFLGNYMSLMFNDTLDQGFSGYSSEDCHESLHGSGTCSRFLARDFKCQGRYDIITMAKKQFSFTYFV